LKFARLLLLALLILAAMNAGCIGFIRDTYKTYMATPVPSPTLMPTATSTPINRTIEWQYMYTEKFRSGIGHFNDAIRAFNASRMAADRSSWANATQEIGLAKIYMEQARVDFLDMKPYGGTPEEIMMSEKWNETAYFEILAFDFANFSYQEGAYQATRSFAEQNPVRYNYYVDQANVYLSIARQSKAEAEELEGRTFIGQQGQIL